MKTRYMQTCTYVCSALGPCIKQVTDFRRILTLPWHGVRIYMPHVILNMRRIGCLNPGPLRHLNPITGFVHSPLPNYYVDAT